MIRWLSLRVPNKMVDYLKSKCPEKQIFAWEHQGHCILKPWEGFCLIYLALPLLDRRVHPESLGIGMTEKLLNTLARGKQA